MSGTFSFPSPVRIEGRDEEKPLPTPPFLPILKTFFQRDVLPGVLGDGSGEEEGDARYGSDEGEIAEEA